MSSNTPRPFTRAQALDNQAFLTALRRTGNVRLSARTAGLKYGTVQYRRSKHPAFAQAWDAALVFAQARLSETGLRSPAAARLPSSDGAGGAAGRALDGPRSAGAGRCAFDKETAAGPLEPAAARHQYSGGNQA